MDLLLSPPPPIPPASSPPPVPTAFLPHGHRLRPVQQFIGGPPQFVPPHQLAAPPPSPNYPANSAANRAFVAVPSPPYQKPAPVPIPLVTAPFPPSQKPSAASSSRNALPPLAIAAAANLPPPLHVPIHWPALGAANQQQVVVVCIKWKKHSNRFGQIR